MPELPEVEVIARQLQLQLLERRVRRVVIHRADVIGGGAKLLSNALSGRSLSAVGREGKRARLTFGDVDVVFALGMSGKLTVSDARSAVPPHTHLRIRFDDDRELRFTDPRRFGGVWAMNGEAEPFASPLNPLGPDALVIRLPAFRKLLETRRPLKPLLLDQQRIAGLGNIYVDESLFRARLHPLTPADALSEEDGKRLLRSIRWVLRRAVAAGGSTIRDYRSADGASGYFQISHKVYGRAGKPCPACGTPLERLLVIARGTTVCPACQPIR